MNKHIPYEILVEPIPYTLKKANIGDNIIIGEDNIAWITHIDKKNNMWCGGMNLKISNSELVKVVDNDFIKYLKLINAFKEGDYVEGLNYKGFLIKGEIQNILWWDVNYPIWIRCDLTGYLHCLIRGTIKLTKRKHSFINWIKKFS